VNHLLGPALKSLYDIEAVTLISAHHLPDEVYAEAAAVFSEQELVDLNLAVMSINSWNRLSIPFRYEPEPE
jgi:alkylhydroperoxidase family enzyme